ncbi:MAG: hypothetical protein OXG11_11785, partial [Chloroflexi bacterium]|nr:hypothetical protein [Chloroflexota bacterium]
MRASGDAPAHSRRREVDKLGAREEYACFRGTILAIHPDGTTHTTEIEDAVTESDITRRGWNRVRVVARGRHYQFF